MKKPVQNTNRLKIRVEYLEDHTEQIAGAIITLLEHLHFEVLEWSREFPVQQEPESNMRRTYLVAVKKGDNEK